MSKLAQITRNQVLVFGRTSIYAIVGTVLLALLSVESEAAAHKSTVRYRCEVERNSFVGTLPKEKSLDIKMSSQKVYLNEKPLFYQGQNPYTGNHEFSVKRQGPVGISIGEALFNTKEHHQSGSRTSQAAAKIKIRSKSVGYWVYDCGRKS